MQCGCKTHAETEFIKYKSKLDYLCWNCQKCLVPRYGLVIAAPEWLLKCYGFLLPQKIKVHNKLSYCLLKERINSELLKAIRKSSLNSCYIPMYHCNKFA